MLINPNYIEENNFFNCQGIFSNVREKSGKCQGILFFQTASNPGVVDSVNYNRNYKIFFNL